MAHYPAAAFFTREFYQVNNEAFYPNPHPFWLEQQSGMLRVKELAQPSPPNHKTHRTPCPTTGHLEEVSGTARQEGGFSEAVNSEMEHQSFPK